MSEIAARHCLECLEIFRREDVPFLSHQRHHHAVGATEIRLMFRERLDVRVSLRELLLEAGVDPCLRGKPKQHHRGQQKNGQHRFTTAEHPLLHPCRGIKAMPTAAVSFLTPTASSAN